MPNLRDLRRRAGFWSAKDLAEVTGLHEQTIYGIERGNTVPNLETMRAIARALAERTGRPVADVLAELMGEEVEHAGAH